MSAAIIHILQIRTNQASQSFAVCMCHDVLGCQKKKTKKKKQNKKKKKTKKQ